MMSSTISCFIAVTPCLHQQGMPPHLLASPGRQQAACAMQFRFWSSLQRRPLRAPCKLRMVPSLIHYLVSFRLMVS